MKPTETHLFSIAALVVSLAGCQGGTHLSATAHYAPSFQPRGATVALLGVLERGTLDPGAWPRISRMLSPMLGSPACEIGMSEELEQADPRTYSELEREVAEEGITDVLLLRFAQRTDAALILTIATTAQGVDEPPEPPPPPRRKRVPGHLPPRRQPPPDPGPGYRVDMMIRASLFSVRDKVSVGSIEVRYRGPNQDDAIRAFAAKVAAELGGSTCRPWRLPSSAP